MNIMTVAFQFSLPTCMLLDTLVKSLFEPGRVPHLHIQISLLASLFLHGSHREDLHLTLHLPGLRLLWLQTGLQGGPQDVHHLLDGAGGGVGDSLGEVDPPAQQASGDGDVVTLQPDCSPLSLVQFTPYTGLSLVDT